MPWFKRKPRDSVGPTIDSKLARAIDETFGEFLRTHDFKSVPSNVTGPFAKWVAVYVGREFKLIFEFGSKGDVGVVAQALDNRLRGGALEYLVPFLCGSTSGHPPSIQTQAETLTSRYREIAALLYGREDERFREFSQWVEMNWAELTREAKSAP